MSDSDDRELCRYPGQRGPCQNPATEGVRCWIESHTEDPGDPPDVVTDGRGAPEDNAHAVGNDGGAPEGNTNAMEHGLRMTAERLLEVMDERQKAEVKSAFLDFQQVTMNDRNALKLAVFDVMETTILRNLAEEDLHELVESDGGSFDRFMQEKVEAAQSFRREVRLGLHYEGHSAQHTSGVAGHDNLNRLVESGDQG